MIIRPGIELGNLTDVGCQREENQDSYCYAEPESDEEFRKRGRLVMIADGMGGHVGGKMASGIAVDVFRLSFIGSDLEEPEAALTEALSAAHLAIRGYVREHPEYSGMGTTCTAAVLRNGHLYYCHVGDSRLYLVRGPRITQLTRDHTMVGRMVEQGLLRPDEVKDHPDRHVLVSAMGVSESLFADLPDAPIPLFPEDILLLCTDGLYDTIGDEELRLQASQSAPATACKQLIETAKTRGGHDNITLQIVKVTS
jgi:protein phosphatase